MGQTKVRPEAFAVPLTQGIAKPAALDARQIEQTIARLQSLPAFYPALQKALRLAQDPDAGNSQLQQAIHADQAIAARVLQLANSAYFGFYSRVQTVSLAVSLIGRERTTTLLLRLMAEELLTLLAGYKAAAGEIRRLSLATSAAAHTLADRMLRSDKEEILLAGLLHNIGDLMMFTQFREHYEEVLRLAEEMPRAEAEKAVFGMESRVAGKRLLEAWNFPPFFPSVVEHHTDPWSAHFPTAPLAAIALIHGARQMAEAAIRGDDSARMLLSLPPRLLSTLEVDREFLADVYDQLPEAIARLSGEQD